MLIYNKYSYNFLIKKHIMNYDEEALFFRSVYFRSKYRVSVYIYIGGGGVAHSSPIQTVSRNELMFSEAEIPSS